MPSCPLVEPPDSILVGERNAGQRLDVFAAAALGVSRGYVRRLLARGQLSLRGRSTAKGSILRAGDRLDVRPFRHPDEGPAADPEVSPVLIAEADGLLALDKPAGIPTHPLDYEERGTLLNGLLALRPELAGIGEGGLRSGVVHRLDTGTSGVQLFAVREEAWARARRAFAEHRVEKRYVARVHGRLDAEHELELRMENRGPRMRVVSGPGRGRGREALTRVRPLLTGRESSLVELEIVTGLRHQIRASLAWLGHPVVGDRLYGSPWQGDRHLLHAVSIRLEGFEASSQVPVEIAEERPGQAAETRRP